MVIYGDLLYMFGGGQAYSVYSLDEVSLLLVRVCVCTCARVSGISLWLFDEYEMLGYFCVSFSVC